MRGWVQRVSDNPEFKFTAKLWSGFTHDRKATQQDDTSAKNGLDVLAGADSLGALLLQFPWSFKLTPDSRAYVAELCIAFCDIDQPLIGALATAQRPGNILRRVCTA